VSQIRVACATGSTLSLDGVKLKCAKSPLVLRVDAGLHVIQSEDASGAQRDTSVEVPKASASIVEVDLLVVALRASPTLNATGPAKASPILPIGWLTFGVGAAVTIGGGVLAGIAKLRYDDVAARCEGGCDDLGFRQRESARTQATVATGLLIGGGVVALAGIVLVILSPKAAPKAASYAWRGVQF
jgi:hypothetical protein